jgi:hypothetical protein
MVSGPLRNSLKKPLKRSFFTALSSPKMARQAHNRASGADAADALPQRRFLFL